MKNSVLKQSILVVGASAILAAALWGCGGGGAGSTVSSSPGLTRGATLTVQWPDRTRLIPVVTESIEIVIDYVQDAVTPVSGDTDCTDGNCVRVIDRPSGSAIQVSNEDIDGLLLGAYMMTARAYNQNGAAGDIVASNGSGNAVAVIEDTDGSGGRQSIPITLGSTVDSFDVTLKVLNADSVGGSSDIWQGNVVAQSPPPAVVLPTSTSIIATEGAMFELVAEPKSKGGAISLRYLGNSTEELQVRIGSADVASGSSTLNRITAAGRFPINPTSGNTDIDIIYRDTDEDDGDGLKVYKIGRIRLTNRSFASTAASLTSVDITDPVDAIDQVQDLDFRGSEPFVLYRVGGNSRLFPGNSVLQLAGAVNNQRFAADSASGYSVYVPFGGNGDVSASSDRTSIFQMNGNGTVSVGGTSFNVAGASFGGLAVGHGLTNPGGTQNQSILKDQAFFALRADGNSVRQFVYKAPSSQSTNMGSTVLDMDSRDGYVFILLASGRVRVLSSDNFAVVGEVNLGTTEYDRLAVGRFTSSEYPIALLDVTSATTPDMATFTWMVN